METPSIEGEGIQDMGKKKKAAGMEIGDKSTLKNTLLAADPLFGEGCQYYWPLQRGDADLMLLEGQCFYNVEELL